MALEIDGTQVSICEEGYLLDPEAWTPAVARALAAAEGIELSEAHWRVLRFMREYYETHRIAPDARLVMKHLANGAAGIAEGRSALYELFPYGYASQACRIAGMRRPRAWSTG